jgi:hypothetical protein
MTTNELKVILFLKNGMKKPILEFFDPLLFLKASPVILSDKFINEILEYYLERSRYLNILDTFFLYKLNSEASIKNIVLEMLLSTKEVSKKLTLFNNLYTSEDFMDISGVEYFEKYPDGRSSVEFN